MYIISLVKKMRIRYKKWARPELEASKFYIDNPEEWKGKWEQFFKNPEKIILDFQDVRRTFIFGVLFYRKLRHETGKTKLNLSFFF